MSLDDFHFDERDRKLTEAILEGVKGIIKPVENNLKRLIGKLNDSTLLKEPFVYSESPKKITETGRKFLETNNIKDFLNQCQFFKEVKIDPNKADEDIFIDCFNWVETHEKDKNP